MTKPISGYLAIFFALFGAYLAWELWRSLKRGESWFQQPLWEIGGSRNEQPLRFWIAIGCQTMLLLLSLTIIAIWLFGERASS